MTTPSQRVVLGLLFFLALGSSTATSTAFVTPLWGGQRRTTTIRTKSLRDDTSQEDDDQDDSPHDAPHYFDDFAELDTSGLASFADDTTASPTDATKQTTDPFTAALASRLTQVQAATTADAARVARNWEHGNWQVRGFTLDASDALVDERAYGSVDATPEDATAAALALPITVCALALSSHDDDGPQVWVGRTDGSLLLVQLGSEGVASFQSQLAIQTNASADANATLAVQVASRLVRQEPGDWQIPPDDDDEARAAALRHQQAQAAQDPFCIRSQLQAYDQQAVRHLVTANAHAPSETTLVYTVAAGGTEIQAWQGVAVDREEDDDGDGRLALVATPTLTGVHTSPIVALQAVSLEEDPTAEATLLLSVSTDGSLAVWDIAGGDLLITCCLPGDSAGVTSATAGAGHWWIATADGRVLGYPLAALLESAANDGPCPLPVGDWAAAADDVAVTALTCLGRTRVGQGPSARDSLVVVTGDATGQVKQWDLLERANGSGGIALDAWPKMPRQRWPHRAHVLTGHDSPITALVPTAPPSDDSQPLVLAAAQDGSLRAWNGKTGSERVRMEGFTDQLRSLCVIGQDLLLTDGNGPHVTIHDFLHGPEDALKETDLEWDWDE